VDELEVSWQSSQLCWIKLQNGVARRFSKAFFERETELPGRSKASQTDLLAVFKLHAGNGIVGVEGSCWT
jgi:hypothetical protein